MSPLLTKLLVTLAAVGVYVLASFRHDLIEVLYPLAGAMMGGMWVSTPGSVAVDKIDGPVPLKAVGAPPEVVVVARDVTPPRLPPVEPPA